jgi:inhibitor of KinA
MTTKPTYQQFGDRGLLINWPAGISEAINEEVLQMDAFVSETFKKEILETVPAYHSLAVYLRVNVNTADFIKKIKSTPVTISKKNTEVKHLIRIPVCYHTEFGSDLEEVAKLHQITTEEVVRLHADSVYKVYFLGFLPGFPYLGGLNEQLHTPRKSIPRSFIEKGSVGIGGSQTGIYTSDSPGGWNIIGKCPLQFFSTEKSLTCLLHPGDYVRFVPVSMKKFSKIEAKVAVGKYILQKEIYHD